jgi:membrane-associated protein
MQTLLNIFLEFHWTQLLQPQWYIDNAGLWFIVFVVFAETGLFAGFFLPGDSLLFVAGIYNKDLVKAAFGFESGFVLVNLLILCVFIAVAAILGNLFGYWFGKKSGPYLFERKDTMLFKKKYLFQARDFYEKHGGRAIVIARFIPIVRTFAPIIAGVVGMNRAKFAYYNIIGSIAWVVSMTFGGHYLQTFILEQFQFDLKQHLEVIVLGIVFISTTPVLIKILSRKKTKSSHE